MKKVVTLRMPGCPVVACAVSIGFGWRHEPSADAGIAHALEHTRVLGTRSYPEVDAVAAKSGSMIDGRTDAEQTLLYFVSLRDDMQRLLPVLLDVVFSPTFPEDAVTREADVLRQSLVTRSDFTPWDWARLKLDDMLFGWDELASLGTADSMRRLGPEMLHEWHGRSDDPGNCVLLVAGDVSSADVEGCLPAAIKGRPGTPALSSELRAAEARTYYDCLPGQRPELWTGFPIPQPHDASAADLLGVLLGNHPSSRSWRAFREETSLAYTVDSSVRYQSDGGRFAIYLGLGESEASQPAWVRLRDLLMELAGEGPTEEELAWAKRVARLRLHCQTLTPMGAVNWLISGAPELPGTSVDGRSVLRLQDEALAAQTGRRIQELAQSMFSPGRGAISMVGDAAGWEPQAALEVLDVALA